MLLTFLPMALGSSMMILLFVTPGAGGSTTWIAGGLMVVTPEQLRPVCPWNGGVPHPFAARSEAGALGVGANVPASAHHPFLTSTGR